MIYKFFAPVNTSSVLWMNAIYLNQKLGATKGQNLPRLKNDYKYDELVIQDVNE